VMRILSLACFLAITSVTMSEAQAASPYVIDGLRLGSSFTRARNYQCKPSEQFAESTFCRRNDEERGRRGRASSITKLLHDRDGILGYVSREVRPAFYSGDDIANEIKRLSTRFGQVSREVRFPDRDEIRNMRIVIWGELELQTIEQGRLPEVQSPGAQTLLIDHLGDIKRSKRLGLPIYRLKGGPGFLWSAASDEDGRGHLRFLVFDAAALTAPAAAAKTAAPRSPQPETAVTSASSAPVVTTGTLKEAGSPKNEKKRIKAEDRLPQASDYEAALAAEQRRVIAAERLAAEERVKASLAWVRFEADQAAREARERLMWLGGALFVALLGMLALLHRMHRPEQQTWALRRLIELASAALAFIAKARISFDHVYQKALPSTAKLIARGRAVLALSHAHIASHLRS
jgi:hypothetical protein